MGPKEPFSHKSKYQTLSITLEKNKTETNQRGTAMKDVKTIWPRGIPTVGQKAELTRQVLVRDIEMFHGYIR